MATSAKRRFAISDDGRRVRASQGHSIRVGLGYQPRNLPGVLFHGTVRCFLPAIRAEGLKRMRRHHAHLSPDVATARDVGQRRARPIVWRIDAGRMHLNGHVFFQSENGVWLADAVPLEYIDIDITEDESHP